MNIYKITCDFGCHDEVVCARDVREAIDKFVKEYKGKSITAINIQTIERIAEKVLM